MSAASGNDASKKHRHDVGAPDHAAVTTEGVTRTIQVILGLCIVLSAALTVYALVHAGFAVSAP
jgi:hydrogenase maturation factor